MANGWPPPWWTPPEGRNAYLPEDFYFADPSFAAREAARVTSRCVARWSDHYLAHRDTTRKEKREGMLPATPELREQFIDELFDWFGEAAAFKAMGPELSLRLGDDGLLDAHDGFPARLLLPAERFQELQVCLEAEGLPADLYYPLEQRHEIVEPVPSPFASPGARAEEGQPIDPSTLLLGCRWYSPRQWAARDAAAIAALTIPSEEERRSQLKNVAWQLQMALHQRAAQLREPGRDPRTEELLEIEDLTMHVAYLNMVVLGSLGVPSGGRLYPRATAGWAGVPTALQTLESVLPALRRLHGRGTICVMRRYGINASGEVTKWGIELRLPDGETDITYTAANGVLYSPGSEHRVLVPRGVIVSLEDGALPELIDTPRVKQISDENGGREFAEAHDAPFSNMSLFARADGVLVWETAYVRHCPYAVLSFRIDGRSGAVLSREEKRSTAIFEGWAVAR